MTPSSHAEGRVFPVFKTRVRAQEESGYHADTYKDLKADNYGFYYVDGNYAVSYFRETAMLDIVSESNLQLHIKKFGYWRGEKYIADRWPAGYQDLFILRKE